MKKSMIIHPDELSERWIDRLVDNAIDILGIHPCGGQLSFQYIAEMLDLMQTQTYRNLIDYAKQRGLEIEYELHAFSYLLPRDLFGVHPTYFRENAAGERTPDYNFCVSNEQALSLIAKRAATLALSLYGTNHRFYFWMDDGKGIRCHCEKCRHLSASDQQLVVLNRILQEIKKHLPDASLAYLAYMDTLPLPQQVKPEQGIFLEYAPFEKYTAKGADAAQLIERERALIAPLMTFFGQENAKLLEYWYDNSMFSGWKKPPKKFTLDTAAMQADFADYQPFHFTTASTFACYLGADYEALHGDVDITPFASL